VGFVNQVDFKALFYTQYYNRNNFVEKLNGFMRTEPNTLNIIPYASELSPIDHFKNYSHNRKLSHIYSQDGVSLFNLVYKARKKDKQPPILEGNFYVYEYPDLPNTYILLTLESQEFLNIALLPLVQRTYPRIFFAIMNQQYISTLLHEFRDKCNFTDLRVIRTVLKSRFTGSKLKNETIIPSINWPKIGLDGAFDFAKDQNGWFSSISFEAWKNSRLQAEITVTRNGRIRTSQETLAVFENLVSPICKIAHEDYELFKRRSRKDSPSLDVRPITINFGGDQLADKDERLKLIEAMRLLNRASLSVVHNNPYLQMSLVDYVDGSTFDLWVINSNELTIIPQMKGTVSAIRRLVSHIFDSFAEGQIEDFQLTR
jgi:hypothetical protein